MNPIKRTRLSRFAAATGFTAIALALGLTGCSGFFQAVISNPTGNGVTSFAYVIHSGGTLAEYSLSSGVLASLTGSPVTLPVTPTAIAVSPNNDFVFVGTATGVFLYTINSDGTLTEGNDDTVIYLNQTIATPVIRSMVVDPTSSWLIIAYQSSTEIDAVPIDPTSGLPTTASAYGVITTFATPSPVLAISPNNSQVFVALGTGGTEAFGFTPKPTSSSGSPWGTAVNIAVTAAKYSANGVSVDPTSTFVFIAESNGTTTSSVGTVRMLATANLTADLSDQPTGVGPSAVLAELSGAYVYVTNQTDNTISGYTVDKTSQTITSLGAPFPTEASPIGIVEDHSKAHLMTVGSLANPNLWLYSFDASTAGSLDVKTTTSTATVNPALANGIAVTY